MLTKLKSFPRKNKEIDIEASIQKRLFLEEKRKREEEDRILQTIEEKRAEFIQVQAPIYEEKLKELSKPAIRAIAQACLAEYTLYMGQLGVHLVENNIKTGKRVIGKMIEDLSNALQNFPREVFAPNEKESIQAELILFLEFLYVYEELQPEWLKSSFMFLKAAFPSSFIFVPEIKDDNTN